MLIPVAGLTLGIAGTAGAATGKITCTTLTGNAATTITISGVSGSTTTSAAPTLTAASATKCPGYVKKAATNPVAEDFTASVTGDTGDGILIPGTEAGAVCIGTDGSITALKALKISWTASSISCTTITGSSSLIVSGCTGGDTGGSSTSLSAATLATGGTITWSSGSSTTIGAPTITATSATKCPGYVKKAANNPTAENFTAAVTSDTGDGLKLPGTAKGAVCIGTDGSITALKPLTAK
jgi:hypothetical protein